MPAATEQPAPQSQGSPDLTDPATRLRATIGRLARRLRSTAAGSQLTPSQISVLFTIARSGPLGLTELSEIESINPTMLSRITAQLCSAGLIVRQASSEDRRVAVVEATATGRRLRRRIHHERTSTLEEHVAKLTDEQQKTLWSALPALEALAEQLPGRLP